MSEFCQNCEGYYDTVYRVPDGIWERLTGHIDGRGLLCPACCDLLARRAGLELYWEAAVGEYPVAAEREACVARLEGLVEKFKSYEYTVERVSYIADLLEAEVAAIRARAGEEG